MSSRSFISTVGFEVVMLRVATVCLRVVVATMVRRTFDPMGRLACALAWREYTLNQQPFPNSRCLTLPHIHIPLQSPNSPSDREIPCETPRIVSDAQCHLGALTPSLEQTPAYATTPANSTQHAINFLSVQCNSEQVLSDDPTGCFSW